MTYSTSTLDIGSTVEWRSAGDRVRQAQIVKLIPAGLASARMAREFAQGLVRAGTHRAAFTASAMRRFPSYLVAVRGGKTDRAKPALYWPPASQLRPIARSGS